MYKGLLLIDVQLICTNQTREAWMDTYRLVTNKHYNLLDKRGESMGSNGHWEPSEC